MKKVILCLFVLVNLALSDEFKDGLVAYETGETAEATKLFEKACDNQNPKGCYNLAVLHKNGKGTQRNYEKAEKLYQKSCYGGFTLGCIELGSLYKDGLGMMPNLDLAKRYYKKACDMGDWDGCDEYKKLNLE